MKRPLLLIAFSVLPWALAVAGLGWLIVQRFPPSGMVVFDVPFDGRSAWINPFLPGERVSSPGPQEDAWVGQRLFDDPVYTSARIPGVYDEVEINMEFRPIRQTLAELGLVKDANAGAIDFQPIWFAPLQDEAWKKTPQGFHRATDDGSVAVWHATATMPSLSDPASATHTTRVTLRGTHDIYAVPAGGQLRFDVDIQDVNRASGPDTVLMRLYRDGEELSREALGIGGRFDQGMGMVTQKTINVTDALPGVYRIQIVADDDVFIRAITTNARHWVVGPRLFFGDDVGFATSTLQGLTWTDSRHAVLETFHVEGLQRVTLGGDAVTISRMHEPFRLDRTDALRTPQRFSAPKGDVRVIGDGWFAFSPDAWFAPQPRRLTDALDPVAEQVTTILTPYERPMDLGDGWVQSITRFRLDPSQDTIRLALSVPGIITRSGALDIRRIVLTYRRAPLSFEQWFAIAKQEAGNVIRRLRNRL